MYELIAENERGQRLELTNNNGYVIKSVSGLSPADATINTTKIAGSDGSTFNNAYVNNRQIIITLAINEPAEDNRLNLYRYFVPKKATTLYFKNDTRNVKIVGYVKAMDCGLFDKKQIAQIELTCPDAFFSYIDEDTFDFYSVDSQFEFPFSIGSAGVAFSSLVAGVEQNVYNDGDVDTGGVFIFQATGEVSNPIVFNAYTNEYFRLNVNMVSGDEITINTNENHKSVIKRHDGVNTSIVGMIDSGSTWLRFQPTDNIISFDADSGAVYLSLTVILNPKYQGV